MVTNHEQLSNKKNHFNNLISSFSHKNITNPIFVVRFIFIQNTQNKENIMQVIYSYFAANSTPFLMEPCNSGKEAFSKSSSNGVSFPNPKFLTIPDGPNNTGVAK